MKYVITHTCQYRGICAKCTSMEKLTVVEHHIIKVLINMGQNVSVLL